MDRDELIRFARQNRQDPGFAELRFWREVQKNALGVRFRRQDPIGEYIVDFSCRQRRLIVEIDDMSHDADRDAIRDAWFIRNDWFVLRIADFEVLESLDEVIELVQVALTDPHSIKDPLHLES